jgi:hypothetical protein
MKQNWQAWLRACSKNPNSPAKLAPGALGALTGQDARALAAIAACWELYAGSDDDGQRAAIAAVRHLLPAVQYKNHLFARELIAFALDWSDRDRIWRLVMLGEELDGS